MIERMLDGYKSLSSTTTACVVRTLNDSLRPMAYVNRGTVTGANTGINERFQGFLDNPCFRHAAIAFWTDIAAETKTEYETPRPALDEVTGQGRYAKYKPGWLWEKASKVTGGDNYLTVQLLAMCMHDDVSHVYSETLTGADASREWASRREEFMKMAEETRRLVAEQGDNQSPAQRETLNLQLELRQAYLAKNAIWEKEQKPVTRPLNPCGEKNTAVYAQGSVDPSLVLPEKIKQDIFKFQKPGVKNPTLPSKAYHFMAGAMLGCELSKCGLSGTQAGQVTATIGRGYRILALREKIKKVVAIRTNRESAMGIGIDRADYPSASEKYLKTHEYDPPAGQLPSLRQQEEDAATLYMDWYLGGTLGEVSGIRLRGPTDVNQSDYKANGAQRSTLCGYPQWTTERCRRARLTLASWDIDETWTKTQHEIGGKFGANACAKSPGGSDRLDTLCKPQAAVRPSPASR